MSSPSWRQFAAIPFDATVASVVRALGVEVPPEGRPRTFSGPGGFLAAVTSDGDWVVCEGGAARFAGSAAEVLRAAKLTAGTPSGDALRQWLRWWGWVPKSEQRQAEPQEQTRQIV
jgi:hypothetical protein